MLSKRNYRMVANNEFDVRIPLHSDEAFQTGIIFQAKYIGSLDVPRPNNRLEIVSAMRRIRYDFKSRGLKKRKVTFQVSVDGVRVTLRHKKKLKQRPLDDVTERNLLPLMHHPVYRIFYVSHDSQDLKIFSYIARDPCSNLFRCNVFKTNKKSEAMKIVRTVGQAFEVCHKLAATSSTSTAATTPQTCRADDVHQDQHRQDEEKEEEEEEEEEDGQEEVGDTFSNADVVSVESHIKSNQEATLNQSESQHPGDCSDVTLPLEAPPPMDSGGQVTSLALQHEVLLLKQQVEQQQQQTQAAIGQVKLLKDQLAAETAARMDAQTRTHQLLIHNKELLDHIQTLVLQMQQLESKVASAGSSAMLQQNAASTLPQLPLTARIMEWLQLQPISRQESGFVESVTIEEDDNPPQRHDVARQSLPSSSKLKTSRRWKFLSRKSSWRSL